MKRKFGMAVVALGLLAFMNTIYGGFTEEIGGYKARLSIGDVMTGNKPSNMEDYYSLSDPDKRNLIIAVKMAECGYPDERNDIWKEGTGYRLLGMDSPEDKNKQDVERAELNRILKNTSKDSKLRVFEQPIYKTVKDKNGKDVRKKTGTVMLTITGKDDDRLSARILRKEDGTIAVVFCGTDWGEGGISIHGDSGDARDDAKQLTHLLPTPLAYKEAAELLRAVKAAYPDSNIEVFGHSEGGGMAQYAVLHSGILETACNERRTVKCYGVNSAGLNGLESVNDLKDELKGNNRQDNEKNKAIVKKYTEENFTLIQNEGEWCSHWGYQFGRFVRVSTIDAKDKDGKETEVVNHYGKTVVLNDMNKQHGVEETRLKMEYSNSPVKEEQDDNGTSNANESPFNSNPDPVPQDDPTPTVNPVPRNTTQVRPSSPTRVRRGGGGDTSAIIWQKR